MNVATCSFSTWNLSQCVIKGLKQPGNCNLVYYSASYPLVWSSSEGKCAEIEVQICTFQAGSGKQNLRGFYIREWSVSCSPQNLGFENLGWIILNLSLLRRWESTLDWLPAKSFFSRVCPYLVLFCFCFRGQPAPPLWQVGEIDVWLLLYLLLCKTIWCL